MNPNPSFEQKMVAGVGHHGLWGYSSTFDMLEALESSGICSVEEEGEMSVDDEDPIRILLVHPGDIRHIITTMSRRRRHGTSGRMRPIHFYLMETPVEVIGRELMLLEILFDFEVPIRQRAGVFLEVYGNALVQERTSRYLERLGYEMRDLIQDGTGRLEDVVDLSCLKYREKDDLERCWKSYARNVPFEMRDLRDHRLRGWHAERYDSRKQLADMDYHSGLRETASIIHIKQFKEWRVSGIAYELGDHVYTEPNRTMMSFTEGMMKKGKDSGLKKDVKGYWGDIISSPYFSFGVDVDSRIVDRTDKTALSEAVVSASAGTGAAQLHKHVEGLFEIMNKNTGTEQHRHHTVEVALYNLFSVLWEMETGGPYKMVKAHDIYSGLGAEAGFASDIAKQKEKEQKEAEMEAHLGMEGEGEEEEGQVKPPLPPDGKAEAEAQTKALAEEDEEEEEEEEDIEELAKQIKRAECIVATLQDTKVFPMVGTPSSCLYRHLESGKYRHFFDAAFVSSRAAGCLAQPEFVQLLKPDGQSLLCAETAKFMVALGRKQKTEFDDKLLEMILGAGLVRSQGRGQGGLSGGTTTGGGVVPRRRRDEADATDDVCFFQTARASASA